ncbi:hypothetical protein [Ferruginibacter sp.]|nr:hypothetical protein [Ferruginibacter sp.]
MKRYRQERTRQTGAWWNEAVGLYEAGEMPGMVLCVFGLYYPAVIQL